MRNAILAKYALVRYYYTQMFLLSTDAASVGTFYKPLFFEFPNDKGSYSAVVSENVMLGSALKLSHKTAPNTNLTDEYNPSYFPQGNWCDILHPETVCVFSGPQGHVEALPAGLKDFQVHLRDGFIVPLQDA